jgi:pyruvate/2-oxoglutarate dehydrogenase complex dihydrolipoamide acyltransferase (E2) component
MANNELPKAQLGAIVKMAKGAYQGMKTGYKTYKAASLAEKAAKLKKAQAAARTQKAAATRAANAKAANAAKNSKTGTPKPATPKPATPKGKEPFVKSKARLATENVVGKAAGYATFGTGNVLKRALKKPIIQGGLGIGTGLYIYDRYKKTNAPKKVKRIKK